MEVEIIDHTGKHADPWYAARLLVFTKSTRLQVTPMGRLAVWNMEEEEIKEELAYMANTIRSSWEFVNYTFLITGVTRAFTHQFVRHRHGKYAQQTQQVLEVVPNHVRMPDGLSQKNQDIWHTTTDIIGASYLEMIKNGARVEQARGLLPQHILTNIIAQFDLRNLVDFFHQRISPRNAGETSEVAISMRDAVLAVHPWAQVFLDSTRDRAMAELDREIQELKAVPFAPKTADFETSAEARNVKVNRMLKLVDQLRREG